MSPGEFEFLIHLIWEKISKKDTAFRKAISVQERLVLTLRFLASGELYVSLQYLFKISKQAIYELKRVFIQKKVLRLSFTLLFFTLV
jgi:flagellin-specific chaperone FliS